MLDLQVRMMNKAIKMKEAVVDKMRDERGDTNVISIIIILVVVIGLATVFRNKIGDLSAGIWNKITNDSSDFVM